jgi:hypothetical protein
MRHDNSLKQCRLVPCASRFRFFRIIFRHHGSRERIDLARMTRATFVELLKNRYVLAHSRVHPLPLQAHEYTSSADTSCPSTCTQPPGDARGTLNACLLCPVFIKLIARVNKLVVDTRYLAGREGVLANALGHYFFLEHRNGSC